MPDINWGMTVIGSVFLLSGLFSLSQGISRFLLYRKIKDTPTSKARSAAVGLVELFGKASPRETMRSPFSNAACVYWRLRCEYYQGGRDEGWKEFYSASSSIEFFLDDGTGKLLVDPEDAEIDIPPDYQSTGYLSKKKYLGAELPVLDEPVFRFLKKYPEMDSRFRGWSGNNLRVTEYRIDEGDPLYVMGSAVPGPADGPAGSDSLTIRVDKDRVMYIGNSGERAVLGRIFGSMMGAFGLSLLFGSFGLFLLVITSGFF